LRHVNLAEVDIGYCTNCGTYGPLPVTVPSFLPDGTLYYTLKFGTEACRLDYERRARRPRRLPVPRPRIICHTKGN
jgi:hypothetical protein